MKLTVVCPDRAPITRPIDAPVITYHGQKQRIKIARIANRREGKAISSSFPSDSARKREEAQKPCPDNSTYLQPIPIQARVSWPLVCYNVPAGEDGRETKVNKKSKEA